MNLVTYVNISQKCYIKLITLFRIVPVEMGSLNVLDWGIDKFQTIKI